MLFYVVMAQYGLLNTLWALIFTMSTFAIPYAIWVLRQYGDTIPFELDEAAKVDGATPVQIFYLVYIPPEPRADRDRHLRAAARLERVPIRVPSAIDRDAAHTIPVAMGYFLVTDDSPWSLWMATRSSIRCHQSRSTMPCASTWSAG